ncbi:MAG: type II toxin-antitoxin system Phd/YefM family antitoxin [Candidatus Azobacteroides sp.]|nr:type II toxin-antitoxin system Phd/YefM family antitoxin [Candidatus Azobacteroides sp.]
MRTANYTDLRNNLKSYIDSVINDSETVIVNRGGGAGIVLMSLEEYNAIKEMEYILSSHETMEAVRKGEDDIKKGNVISRKNGESLSDFLERVLCTG